jgi:hypothetical protein
MHSTGKWEAFGNSDGKQHYLGRFDTKEDAAQAVSEWSKKWLVGTVSLASPTQVN